MIWLFAIAIGFVAIAAYTRGNRQRRQMFEMRRRLIWLEKQFNQLLIGGDSPPAAEPKEASPEYVKDAAPEFAEELARSANTERSAFDPPEQPITPETEQPPVAAEPASKSMRESLEALVGERLSVWVAAIAIVLAGGYFVKWSYDVGLFGPMARTVIGIIFGLGLIGAGEYFHKKLGRVAEAMVAAGVGVLFVVQWAATMLLGLMSPAAGWVVLGLISAGGVFLSIRFGQIVALVGLIGGFTVPILVSTGSNNYTALFGHLTLILLAVGFVARRQGWYWLLSLSALLVNLWAGMWLLSSFVPEGFMMLALFLSASSFIVLGAGEGKASGDDETLKQELKLIGSHTIRRWQAVISLALIVVGMQSVPVSLLNISYVILFAAALLILDRLDKRYRWFAVLGAAISALALNRFIDGGIYTDLVDWSILQTALLFYFIIFTGGAAAALVRHERPGYWAALAVGTAVFAYIEMRWQFRTSDTVVALIAVLITAGFASGAFVLERFRKNYEESQSFDNAVGYFIIAAGFFTFFAIEQDLGSTYIPTALTATIALFAYLASIWRPLRSEIVPRRIIANPFHLVGGIYLALVVTNWIVRIAMGSRPDDMGEGLWFLAETLILPGIPLLAGLILYARRSSGRFVETLVWVVFALGVAIDLVLIRLLTHGGSVWWESSMGLLEAGLYSLLFAAAGLGMGWISLPNLPKLFARPAAAMLIVWWMWAVVVLGIIENPIISHASVGTLPVFNWLAWIYAPIILTTAWLLQSGKELWRGEGGRVLALTALGTLMMWLSLEVRHIYQGPILSFGGVSTAENYTYSAVWLLAGIALLSLGIMRKLAPVRFAGLAVVTLATFKVFLFDTSSLEGLYRVASLLGLGMALLVIGYVYRRFVSGTVEAAGGSTTPNSPPNPKQ